MTNEAPTLLVVMGATGIQGGAVLRHFVQHPSRYGFRLRGLTRDPQSAKAQALTAQGIEMVRADLHDPSTLTSAFADATHIFANTDSNQLIYDALRRPDILPAGSTPTTYAAAIEERFGHHLITAAAAVPSLRRLVWSGLPGPRKWSNGQLTAVTMFDAKQAITDRLWATPQLQGKLSVLMIGFYAENALNVPNIYAPKKTQDGVYELSFPMSGDVAVPIADVDRDVGPWVRALLIDAAPGLTLLGATQMLSWAEWLRLWGARNGVPVRYRRATAETFAADMGALQQALMEEFAFVEGSGFSGGDTAVVEVDALRRLGVDLGTSTVAEHIRRTDWTKIL